ncbi:hypothetical protein [Tunturiibacter lichenicola]|uniref:hypothetical protein n=1 Tax=Tunturiibacter lichenicola TaxID=2051959 RepID=UPI0021B2CD0F|nr:hypothetical protein [Edaphobacter lichenicola]
MAETLTSKGMEILTHFSLLHTCYFDYLKAARTEIPTSSAAVLHRPSRKLNLSWRYQANALIRSGL